MPMHSLRHGLTGEEGYIPVPVKFTSNVGYIESAAQSRAERQNTFDWLHILPVRVKISQYKSYSANGSHILPI